MTDDLRDRLQAALESRFAVERELGGGGMSRVFVATERAFGRHVVLKVLRPEVAEAVSIERFRREIQLAARLQHPHIVPLFGGGEADGFLYYTMPLIEGESLRARLAVEGQLSVADALRLARESAEALAYANARGVVHRDIKPENILLSDGHALVTDFGIARAVDAGTDSGERLTSVGIAIGTPAYMSPEQASGETDVDARSDIYSLGCVLYEMLAGEPPFSGPTVQAIIARRFTDVPPSLRAVRPTIAPEIDRLVGAAMATLPADRFASASDFAKTIEQVASRTASTPIGIASATSGPRLGAPAAALSRRGVRLGLAAALVVAVGATTWALARGRTTPSSNPRGDDTPSATPSSSPSVAVLHVRNASADSLDTYLADGLTDEITSALGRVGRLRVKSRAAVGRLNAATMDAAEAGKALGVQYVLRGDLTRLGNRIRADLQLVRTNDDSEAWAGRIETSRDSLFAIRDAVVAQIVSSAGGGLTAEDRAALVPVAAVKPAAHDAFLRGNYHLARRNPVSVAQAITEFEEAHRIDPQMTNALARAGYAYSVFADWGWPHPQGLTNDELIRRGLAAADSALRQDSTSAEAWLARAHLLFLKSPRTLEGVTVAFERAVSLDSTNAEAQYQYGQALMASGNAAEAVARYKRAIALEPDWASPLMSLGALVARSGDFDGGLRWLDSAIAVDPSSSYSYAARSTTRSSAGRSALALQDARSALRVASGYRIPPYAAMAVALASAGDSATARQWADSAVRLTPDTLRLSPTDALYVGAALVRTGQAERGIAMLERAEPKGAWLWFYMTSALFDGVRTRPRFVRLSQRAKPPGA